MIACFGALSLTGCTSLKVNGFDGSIETRRGIAYFLPLTQFDTSVTWAASCDVSTGVLSITPKIEATPKTGPDPDGLQVIDYSSLSAFTKTSNVKVEFHDTGAIKSINASADDRTGEILTSTLVAAGKVVKAIAFAGADPITCSAPLVTALGTAAVVKSDVEKKTGDLEKATEVLTALNARVTREGGSLTDEVRRQHSKQIGEVTALQIELDALKAKLAEALKPVTHAEKSVFPSSSEQFATEKGLQLPKSVLAKWVARKNGETDQQFNTRLLGIAATNSVWAELSVNQAFRDIEGVGNGRPEDGIRYRVAVPGSLKFCPGSACTPAANDDLGGTPDPIKTFPVKVLHKGSTFFLPFRSQAFTNGSLTATFNEAGVMTSAGYEQKRAQGEALASVGATLADQVTSLVTAARENEKTELELIQEATALDKAKKERDDAAQALLEADPDPNAALIASLTSSTALKQAELADTTADIALAEARRKRAAIGDGT
jgi:hypothetical protein